MVTDGTDSATAPWAGTLPRHVAIIMDGNGRWARARGLPRYAGHKAGVKSVRAIVEESVQRKIEVLTLFAFSSENWKRPEREVSLLMGLFMLLLQRETKRLKKNGVRLRIIGDTSAFSDKLQQAIIKAEQETADSDGLVLQVAANYGGRWDITQAARRIAEQVQAGSIVLEDISESTLAAELCSSDLPPPDLFIRTGGEQRLSNFLLWQSAYTELYFSELLWPDFQADAFCDALESFGKRHRRFGRTGEQTEE